MEQQNCLGIYLSKTNATAVLLSSRGAKPTILGCFSVAAEAEDTETPPMSTASAITQDIAARGLKFGEVSVALDCALVTQHDLHSEFTDSKQIAQTIEFDIEEAVATDATTLAISFVTTDTNQTGSNVTVFTAERLLLAEMLADLQTNTLDPTAIEPDIVCLARFLQQNFHTSAETSPLFVILSEHSCYIIIPNLSKSQHAPVLRSFLIGSSQNKTAVLASQIPITIASLLPQFQNEAISSIIIAGQTDTIDYQTLADSTGLEIQTIDLAQTVNADTSSLADCASETDFAIAYGAALAEITKTQKADLRQSFSPYLGKKLIMQKTLRFISISVTILMLAAGIYFQMQVFRKNGYTNQLHDKLVKVYSAVMLGKEPPSRETIDSKLKREYNRIDRIKSGQIADDQSVSAKLTFIFEAIDNANKNIDLKVESIIITSKTMRIAGSTNTRRNTLNLFRSIQKHPKLKKANESLKQAGRRDNFTINLEPQ